MPATIPIVLDIVQICFSLWAASQSYAAITLLQKYEEPSEKAAEVLETAKQELHKTRATHTSGALIIAANIVWSALDLAGVTASSVVWLTGWISVTAGLYLAHQHLANFWNGKGSVPLLKNYNEGIQNSKRLIGTLSTMRIIAAVQAAYYLYAAFTSS